jgi:hypothetical protein
MVVTKGKYRNRRIFARKVDFKAAYHQLHLNYKIADYSCTQLEDKIRGVACAFEWSIICETICDLAIIITHGSSWNLNTLQDPNQHLVPSPVFLSNIIPLPPAKT